MPSVSLKYTPPGGILTTTTFSTILSARGGGFPDEFEMFPGIQHKFLDGAIAGYTKGNRRLIMIDLGVRNDIADAKAIWYFWQDDARVIAPTIAAPANPSAGAQAGGTLPDDTYFYKISAVDEIGETIGSAEVQATTATTNNSVTIDWDAVANAVRYKVYRSLVAGTYGAVSFLAYVNAGTLDYTDDGTVALTPGAPLASADIAVAPVNPNGYGNQWIENMELGKRWVLELQERSIRQAFPG